MKRSIRLIAIALLIGTASCTDAASPIGNPQPGLHFLKWSPANGPVGFSATAGTAAGPLALATAPTIALSSAGDTLVLESYQASFWAVRGAFRFLQINYVNAIEGSDVKYPFLRLSVANPTQRPSGSPVAVGDSVLITVSVHPTNLAVDLAPSGLRFGVEDATRLQIWYGGADGDLNGDGVANDDDEFIEQQLLGLWYREHTTDPWQQIPSSRSLEQKWFSAVLEHFSGYAVSW